MVSEQLVSSILCLNLVHVGPEPSPKYSFQSLKMGMVKSSGIHNVYYYYYKKLAPI